MVVDGTRLGGRVRRRLLALPQSEQAPSQFLEHITIVLALVLEACSSVCWSAYVVQKPERLGNRPLRNADSRLIALSASHG